MQTWRIDTNDVYRLLDQLVAEGSFQAREEPRRDNAAARGVVYRPTDATEGAMTAWMEALLPREPVRLATAREARGRARG